MQRCGGAGRDDDTKENKERIVGRESEDGREVFVFGSEIFLGESLDHSFLKNRLCH